MGFIAAENDAPTQVEHVIQEMATMYLSNRWDTLIEFDRFCGQNKFPFDEQTAVIVDLDKTALGARGRNDHMIDQARVEAVRRTVGDLLGEDFDAHGFQKAYYCLNQTEFHPFTTDNQDYLAYICLILGTDLYRIESLLSEIRGGGLTTFNQFISSVDGKVDHLPPDLQDIHQDVYLHVQRGDPTPFKAFRYNEYLTTVEKMGGCNEDEPVSGLLDKEILITQEVREQALDWRKQGALLFGLSDKPDEASIPNAAQAARGYQAIHHAETHAVGR
jgi:hypothetical protein